MSKKNNAFWILDKYMVSDSASSEVKKYVENLIKENEKLKTKNEQYKKAFEYIDRAIYTQHATMNHMENTEFEKGQIKGLITASNIVQKAKTEI